MSAVAFDGTRVVLSDAKWRHIILRHPEVENAKILILHALAVLIKSTLMLPVKSMF